MEPTVKALSLVAVLGFSPPRVQKILIERVLEMCEIKFNEDTLKEYEEYWSQAIKNYNSNYLHK